MGKFKMQSPIKVDPVPRYEVPFMPDNVNDNSGLVAKANKNGTMIVNKNIPKNSKLYKQAKAHEDHHLKDMMDGKLDYDANAVYHNLDGKGVKKVDRSNFDESNKNLPWEKQAYKAGVAMEDKDMRPNPNKLDGPPNMKQKDTPLSYYKIGTKPRRESDMDNVSMTERFGNAMVKKFGPAKMGCAISKYGGPAKINIGPDTDPSGEGEDEKTLKQKAQQAANDKLAKMEYQSETLDDGTIRYFKSTDATAESPGSTVVEAKGGGAKATDTDDYISNLKERFPDATGEELVKKGYISSSYMNRFPAKKETATASDEYFEKTPTPPSIIPPPFTPPTITTTTNGDDDNKNKFKFKFKGRKGKSKKLKEYCTPDSTSVECVGGGSSGMGSLIPGKGSTGLQAKETKKANVSNPKNLRKVTSNRLMTPGEIARAIKKKSKSEGLFGGKKRRRARASRKSTRR
tara:strand:- start:264 stop:1637 length:1374 start_codon:yes stop_codon:yes gene_type:complete